MTETGEYGIALENSGNNSIFGNLIRESSESGISLDSSNNNFIDGNYLDTDGIGVYLYASNNDAISNNNATDNSMGMRLDHSENSTVIDNLFSKNNVGLYLHSGTDNEFYNVTVYHNRFVDNNFQAFIDLPCIWENGYPSGGNYWSDYTGTDTNHDGIGDTPYVIDEFNIDNYPIVPYTGTSMATTTAEIKDGKAQINQTLTTGIRVVVNDSSIPDFTSITVYSINYGVNQPPETGLISIGGVFYDVRVTSDLANPDTIFYVNFTSSSFDGDSRISYWNGANWVSVPTQFYSPNTICGTFHLFELQGTPIFVTPEYGLGTLLALCSCLAAFIIVRGRTGKKCSGI
jgi:parallel beta-helix repeat protein